MGITALRRYRRTLAARAAERAVDAAEAESETFDGVTDLQLAAIAAERGVAIPSDGDRAALEDAIRAVGVERAETAPEGQDDADPDADDVQHVADPDEHDDDDPAAAAGDQSPGKPDEATEDRIESDLGEQAGRVEDAEDEGREPESVHEQVEIADPADEGREVVAEVVTPEVPADDADELPAGNASTDVWREYAAADPTFTDDPSGLGRDEIRAVYANR